jgi:hypothetical protein
MMIFFVFPTNFAIIAHQQTSFSNEAITMIMVGLDVVAFFVGLVFGPLMHWFRQPVKYFAPLFFLLGYAVYLVPSVTMILLGSAFIGIANGVGIPYLNTIASIKGGKNSATTVMPLLSAALYLGQFVSPLVVMPLSHNLFGADFTASLQGSHSALVSSSSFRFGQLAIFKVCRRSNNYVLLENTVNV